VGRAQILIPGRRGDFGVLNLSSSAVKRGVPRSLHWGRTRFQPSRGALWRPSVDLLEECRWNEGVCVQSARPWGDQNKEKSLDRSREAIGGEVGRDFSFSKRDRCQGG